MSLPDFQYLYGRPNATAELKTSANDFKVFECLPFEPSGEGEHLFIKVRKTGQNTNVVARELARYFGVKDALVSYAGLKDKNAVTEQWFGVHLPGVKIDDLSGFEMEGVDVIEHLRHNKKLKTGALTGNRFEITLRNVSALNEVQQRWQLITHHGVPNYFGEQRFGIGGSNIDNALTMFSGRRVKDKKKRSIYLSAARSLLFNQTISARIKRQKFDQISVGDVLMLAGSQSVFKVESDDADLSQRLAKADVDITAPMWGKGELMTFADVALQEAKVAHEYETICAGLEKFGVKQERRRIRLVPTQTQIQVDTTQNSVCVSFFLPAGCFATSLLRELVNYDDISTHKHRELT